MSWRGARRFARRLMRVLRLRRRPPSACVGAGGCSRCRHPAGFQPVSAFRNCDTCLSVDQKTLDVALPCEPADPSQLWAPTEQKHIKDASGRCLTLPAGVGIGSSLLVEPYLVVHGDRVQPVGYDPNQFAVWRCSFCVDVNEEHFPHQLQSLPREAPLLLQPLGSGLRARAAHQGRLRAARRRARRL